MFRISHGWPGGVLCTMLAACLLRAIPAPGAVLPVSPTETKLTHSAPVPHGSFGISVDLSADGLFALVGHASEVCDDGINCGAAYAFMRNDETWAHAGRLVPSHLESSDLFGGAVALSSDGTRALVGATGMSDPSCLPTVCGAAYVFVRSGGVWVEEAKLQLGDAGLPFGGSGFGLVVDLSDDGSVALVGVPGALCSAGNLCGMASVFRRSGSVWSLEQLLVPSRVVRSAWFGEAVALSGDGGTALVGAFAEPCLGGTGLCGAAYVFAFGAGGWNEQARLAPVVNGFFQFGSGVALSATGDRALISQPNYFCTDGLPCGEVDLFVRTGTTWTLEQKLPGPGTDGLASFGTAVALSGNGLTALVHATKAAGPGVVYILVSQGLGNWLPGRTVVPFDSSSGDGFGDGVALSAAGLTALVGAPGAPCFAGPACGAAYVFQPLELLEAPTAGETALIALALALATMGCLLLRRRRALPLLRPRSRL